MTDWIKEIFSTVNTIGPEYPSLWGAMVWGVDKWGAGAESLQLTDKGIADTLTPTSANLGFSIQHLVEDSEAPTSANLGFAVLHLVEDSEAPTSQNAGFLVSKGIANSETPTSANLGIFVSKGIFETISPASSVGFLVTHLLTDDIAPTSEPAHEYLQDAAGYYREMPAETIDCETRYSPTWSSLPADTESYTSVTVATTTWS